MRPLALAALTIVVVLGGGGCVKNQASSKGCDLAAGRWKQTSNGPCGESSWKFVARSDGSYDASEAGCADARGLAHYDGASVVVDFQYEDGTGKGKYTWPLDVQCHASAGTVAFSAGSLEGQSFKSTLASAR